MIVEIPIYAIFELEIQHVALFVLRMSQHSDKVREFTLICPSFLDLLLQSCMSQSSSRGQISLVDVFRVKYS